MEALVALLPQAYQSMAKAIFGAIGITLTVLSTTLPQVPLVITIALAIVTALGIYQAPAPGYVAPSDARDARIAARIAEQS